MATLTQALNTNFTSTKTSFVVEVRGGPALGLTEEQLDQLFIQASKL